MCLSLPGVCLPPLLNVMSSLVPSVGTAQSPVCCATWPTLSTQLRGMHSPVATLPAGFCGHRVGPGLRAAHSQGVCPSTAAWLHQLQKVPVPEFRARRCRGCCLLGPGQAFGLDRTQHVQHQAPQWLRKALLNRDAQIHARVLAPQPTQQQPPRRTLNSLLRKHLRVSTGTGAKGHREPERDKEKRRWRVLT